MKAEEYPLLGTMTEQRLVKTVTEWDLACVAVIFLNAWIIESVIITCSNYLQVSNKSVYQFKTHV
jgi:hypothetical protein